MGTPEQHTPLIDVRAVSKKFKRFHAQRSLQQWFIELLGRKQTALGDDFFWSLQDVSFAVNRGERIGIIGHNGSGKSTVLKLIAGVLEPTHGEVVVNGRISSLLELGAGFHPDLTGRENVILNATLHGLKRKTIDERLESIVQFAGLEDFIDTPVKHYSSGMYMRLGFSVAFHSDPDLLIIDEVLAVGDAAFQKKCMTAIHHFCQRGGTLVLVTHDLASVETICDRAVWMEKGKVRQIGKPIDVVYRYLSASSQAENESAIKESAQADQIERRLGNRKVEFVDVKLCDDSGQPTALFNHGEAMQVHLSYARREVVEPPVIGIGIHHQNGAHVSGPNTDFDNVEIPDAATGNITYRIPELNLLPGHYYLTVAAVHAVTQEIYDIHDRVYEFHIDEGSVRERYGIVALHGEWRVDAPQGRTHSPEDSTENSPEQSADEPSLVPEAHL